MLLNWWKIPQSDRNAANVMDLKAMQYLRFHLRVLNLWPMGELNDQPKWRPYLTYGHIVHGILCWSVGFAYIVTNMGVLSFFEIGHSYITSMLFIVCMSRIPLPLFKRYKDVSRDFVSTIHLFNIRNRSAYAMETYVTINKITHFIVLYLIALTWLGTTLFSVMAISKNYMAGNYNFDDNPENSTRKFIYSVYSKLPFDIDHTLKNHIVVSFYNWIIGLITIDGVLFGDGYMCLIVTHLWGRFKILIHELDSFPRPKTDDVLGNSSTLIHYVDMFSPSELPLIHEKLKECIKTHYELSTFVDNMSTTFGPILFVYNGFHLAACCLLLLECSVLNTEALVTYLPLTSVIFQNMMVLSCVLELLGSVSEKVMDAVYNLPWEYMDKSSRLTVIIFLMKVQEPVRVKVLGMVTIGVNNMAAILKTSFSYFAFLRTVAD